MGQLSVRALILVINCTIAGHNLLLCLSGRSSSLTPLLFLLLLGEFEAKHDDAGVCEDKVLEHDYERDEAQFEAGLWDVARVDLPDLGGQLAKVNQFLHDLEVQVLPGLLLLILLAAVVVLFVPLRLH